MKQIMATKLFFIVISMNILFFNKSVNNYGDIPKDIVENFDNMGIVAWNYDSTFIIDW